MATVVVSDTQPGLASALEEVFAPFGGITNLTSPQEGTFYIKPNAVHFSPHSYTHPDLLEALLAYLRDHGYRKLAVMESCTAGNFTRLVFKVNGYAQICKRYAAKAIYLDEGPTLKVALRGGTRVRIARHLYEQVLWRGGRPPQPDTHQDDESNSQRTGPNFYLNLPKLKTHSMTGVTLGVKNQQAFPIAADRMHDHSHQTLHYRLAALFELVQPDFCLVEGLYATAGGHIPPAALLDERLVPMHMLIGGRDTLAVDTVAARILGYTVDDIEHLRLCAQWGLGESDLEEIDLRGKPLAQFTDRLPHTSPSSGHPDVHWVIGREKACIEGCRGNSLALQELLYQDYNGKGGWTLVCGAGFHAQDLDQLPGDILVVGPCACQEVGEKLNHRYPERKIYTIPEHNDLMANTHFQARLMKIRPLQMVPLNPLHSALLLVVARLRGLRARVPSIFG